MTPILSEPPKTCALCTEGDPQPGRVWEKTILSLGGLGAQEFGHYSEDCWTRPNGGGHGTDTPTRGEGRSGPQQRCPLICSGIPVLGTHSGSGPASQDGEAWQGLELPTFILSGPPKLSVEKINLSVRPPVRPCVCLHRRHLGGSIAVCPAPEVKKWGYHPPGAPHLFLLPLDPSPGPPGCGSEGGGSLVCAAAQEGLRARGTARGPPVRLQLLLARRGGAGGQKSDVKDRARGSGCSGCSALATRPVPSSSEGSRESCWVHPGLVEPPLLWLR